MNESLTEKRRKKNKIHISIEMYIINVILKIKI